MNWSTGVIHRMDRYGVTRDDRVACDRHLLGTISGADLVVGLLMAVRLHLDFTTDQEAAVRI